MSDPDTGITISGNTLTIRTGSRYRTVVIPNLSQLGINTSSPTYHYYDSADVAVQAGPYGPSYDIVWRNLREDAAPNLMLGRKDIPATNGSRSSVPGLGTVVHYLNDTESVIVNVTTPSHLLSPGVVVRLLDQIDGNWVITTVGFGTGAAGALNAYLGDTLWNNNAKAIGRESVYEQSRGGRHTKINWLQPIGQPLIDLNSVPPGYRVIKDATGGFHVVDSYGNSLDVSRAPGQLGRIGGSTLGNYIASDAGVVAQIAASTVLGSIGESFGNALSIQSTLPVKDLSKSFESAFGAFDQTLLNNLKAASIGAVTSFTTMELGRALGLKGFGAELFGQVPGTVVGPVLDKVVGNIAAGHIPFKDFSLKEVFGGTGGFGDLLGAGLASFFGAKLGGLVISPTTTAGAALASLGSAAGAYALSAAGSKAIGGIAAQIFGKLGMFGNILGPGIGAFVGFVLGALIGKLFGKRKPRIPIAAADVNLNLATTTYEIGNVTIANNGNRSLVVNMATVARDSLNGLIAGAVGGTALLNANTVSPTQTYGHNGNQIRARFMSGTWQNFDSAEKAVDWGVVNALQLTKIRGGDIFQKRAMRSQTIESVVSLFGNMQIAADYGNYLRNRSAINGLIRDNPRSEIAAAWIVTLGRVNELGINQWAPSDFYGGLTGFSESFGFGVAGLNGALGQAYEDISVGFEGSALRIAAAGAQGAFGLLSGTNNITDPAFAAQSAYIANFGANVGYTVWSGQATAGNDIWVATAGGPVTMDDTGTQMQGYWHPYYGWIEYPVNVSGGDDIFVGSSYNDTLYGRAGWDWLDGGAGHDIAYGGENDDVLLGRAGVDQMFGEAGNDYLAGGDDNDYIQSWIGGPAPGGLFGGEGHDILVGGGGHDGLFGENGNDLFVVDQDGGGTFDYYDGGAGSDTASFERFASGVSFNLTAGRGSGYTAQTYGDGFVSMENVTGSQFNDVIVGDEVANTLTGLGGNDSLYGEGGDDILEGGIGADTLYGGSGADTASYKSSLSGVVVDLSVAAGLGGDATDDIFSSIENLVGSNLSDELVGSAGNNLLSGLRGDDFFGFTAGSDTLVGGDGFDTFNASGATSSLTVYYDAGYYGPYYQVPGAGWIASVSGMGTSSFSSIESFVGTAYADSLSGNYTDDMFDGGAGNDTLYGSTGSDTYIFGRGDGYDSVTETNDGANAIVLKDGINWRDVAISGAAYNVQNGTLTVSIRGTSDQMVVGQNFSYVNSGSNAGNHNHKIKTLDLGGVSAIDIDMIDYTPSAASESGTVVYGAQNRADLIFSYGGNDTIYAAGNSTAYETRGNLIYAGDGADTIYGGAGDDQYIFERGNGIDTLTDNGGLDTIIMGPSVAADDVIYQVITTNPGSSGWGATADLYIGLRDANNPNLTASQVADRIRVVGGGTKNIGAYYGGEYYTTTDYVRVGGQEIDVTKANINWTINYYYDGGYWPIAIDLDGDGIELRSVEGSRIATVGADGTVTRLGWLGQDDGFLALDRDGSGVIDRMAEISFIGDVEGAKSDLEGLAAYDDNADGKLDLADKRWGEFLIWQDMNQDGFGAKDELVTLDEAGIRSISLKGQATGFTRADGLDNTVLATTAIEWADAARTGNGYDVRLAALQVRTDGGGAEIAGLDAAARGKTADNLDAALYGVQTMTEEQVAAAKANVGKGDVNAAGRLHRIETLLADTPLATGGLYTIDPAVASTLSTAQRTGVELNKANPVLGKIDAFANSEWTQAGRVTPTVLDTTNFDAAFTEFALTAEQKKVVDEARARVVEEKRIVDAALADQAVKDTSDAAAAKDRVVTPPSAEELAARARDDSFRLLPAVTDAETKAATEKPAALKGDQMLSKAVLPEGSTTIGAESEQASASSDSEVVTPTEPLAASASDQSQGALTAKQAGVGAGTEPMAEPEHDYAVVISAANARLVQALAGFGDAPAMMASYRGLNAANDPQTAWLTVDALPSVERMVALL